jgi:hypothetical protein
MGRLSKQSRAVKQIRVKIGEDKEVFLLRKESLTSRADAVRTMRKLHALARAQIESESMNQMSGLPVPIIAHPEHAADPIILPQFAFQETEDYSTFDVWMNFSDISP